MLSQESIENPKEIFCRRFAEKYGILTTQITGYEIEAVYWLEYSQTVIASSFRFHAKRLANEPTWGLLQTMLDRLYEYVSASLLLYIMRNPTSGEVLSRTSLEAAINILYILMGDRVERLWQYFAFYIITERRQNKLWLDTISKYREEVRQFHQAAINQKEKAINIYETVVQTAFKQMGFSCCSCETWPSLFERFKSIGEEATYRTVYAAMCSQAHNDAEDLLNRFATLSVSNYDLQNGLIQQITSFARMLIYFGLQYYLKAIWVYVLVFGLKEAEEELKQGYDVISELVKRITQEVSMQSDKDSSDAK